MNNESNWEESINEYEQKREELELETVGTVIFSVVGIICVTLLTLFFAGVGLN